MEFRLDAIAFHGEQRISNILSILFQQRSFVSLLLKHPTQKFHRKIPNASERERLKRLTRLKGEYLSPEDRKSLPAGEMLPSTKPHISAYHSREGLAIDFATSSTKDSSQLMTLNSKTCEVEKRSTVTR